MPRSTRRAAALLAVGLLAPLACIRGTIPPRELYRIAVAPADSGPPAAGGGVPPGAGALGLAPNNPGGI